MAMNYNDVCDNILHLYLYADATKIIHYTTNKNHTHELCDKLRDTIIDFTDKLAESLFGIDGKPSPKNFKSITLERYDKITDITDRCQVITSYFRSECEDDNKYAGIVSLVDDFELDLSQINFLATFDNNID